jgi:hypothetical protein
MLKAFTLKFYIALYTYLYLGTSLCTAIKKPAPFGSWLFQ